MSLFVVCAVEYGTPIVWVCFFQAEDGIRDLVRSRGLGDVYKRQALALTEAVAIARSIAVKSGQRIDGNQEFVGQGLSLSLIHI